MAFNNTDIIKLAGSVLAAGVIDSNSDASWYEKRLANNFIIDPDTVWADLPMLKTLPASNFSEAVQNAVDNPDLIGLVGINPDGTYDDATAIRMTPVAGTNNKTYVCYRDYNDSSSGRVTNWILPQLIPRPSGAPSAAYQATIWAGPPSQGNMILTSTGHDGNWVSHFWNAAGGTLLIAPSDAPPSASFPSDDLYVTGFTYEGQGASGGGVTGDTVMLTSDSGDYWRMKIDEEGTYLSFDRYEENSDGDKEWVTNGFFGASLTTEGVTLTKPYALLFDKNNDLNSDNPPDIIEGMRLGSAGELLGIGSPKAQTVIETISEPNNAILRSRTLLDETYAHTRFTLRDEEQTIDDDNPEIRFQLSLNVSGQDTPLVPYIRFKKIGSSITAVSDEDNGVPLRVAVYETDGTTLIQENCSIGALNAGVRNAFVVNVADVDQQFPVQPDFVDRQDKEVIISLTVKRGESVTFEGGNYTYSDLQGNTQSQFVPCSSFLYEQVDSVPIFDASNFREKLIDHAGVSVDRGIQGVTVDPNTDEVAAPWNMVSVGQHVDGRNTYIGNFYDKTYINAGEGGIWSLVERPDSRVNIWSNEDRSRFTDNEDPAAFVETTSLSINLNGLFSTEMDDVEVPVVNMYHMMPLIKYVIPEPEEGEDPATVADENQQQCRVTINTNQGSKYTLFESQSYYDWIDDKIPNNEFDYFIPILEEEDDPVYHKIPIPTRTFSLSTQTAKTLNITFKKPVRVYGYMPEGSTDVADFIPSIKADVVLMAEEQILYGDSLENRLDGIIGSDEWVTANERNYSTLHEEPSLMWLADFDEEPILFFGSGSTFSEQDLHQYIWSNGREAIYTPLKTNSGDITVDPVVVHVPLAENVNTFGVTLKTSGCPNADSVEFTLYINSHEQANSFKEEITLPADTSIYYQITKDRNNRFRYRGFPFNDSLASTNSDNTLSGNIPEDPNPPAIVS